MRLTKIMWCPCIPHVFQDKTYGHNFRIHNPKGGKAGTGVKGYTCTVCGKQK
jgi:hypothetical protein